jgi:hypothetical protein
LRREEGEEGRRGGEERREVVDKVAGRGRWGFLFGNTVGKTGAERGGLYKGAVENEFHFFFKIIRLFDFRFSFPGKVRRGF